MGGREVGGWYGGKLVRFGKLTFHVFDQYEIHIQAFVDFINLKLMFVDSSSLTFYVS